MSVSFLCLFFFDHRVRPLAVYHHFGLPPIQTGRLLLECRKFVRLFAEKNLLSHNQVCGVLALVTANLAATRQPFKGCAVK